MKKYQVLLIVTFLMLPVLQAKTFYLPLNYFISEPHLSPDNVNFELVKDFTFQLTYRDILDHLAEKGEIFDQQIHMQIKKTIKNCVKKTKYYNLNYHLKLSDLTYLKSRSWRCRASRKLNESLCVPRSINDLLGINGLKVEYFLETQVKEETEQLEPGAGCQKESEEDYPLIEESISDDICTPENELMLGNYSKCFATGLGDETPYLSQGYWQLSAKKKFKEVEAYESIEEKRISKKFLRKIKKIKYDLPNNLGSNIINQNDDLRVKRPLRDFINFSKNNSIGLSIYYDVLDSESGQILKGNQVYQINYSIMYREFNLDVKDLGYWDFSQTFEVVQKDDVNDVPTFFFRPYPNGQYLGYTTFRNARNSRINKSDYNVLFNRKAKKSFSIPGHYDPVFSPNGRFMIILQDMSSPIEFYKLDELLTNHNNSTPFFRDPTLKGAYQSIGILEKTQERIVYRVIIENGEIYTREYEEMIANGKMVSFSPLGDKRLLCQNLDIKLPMISKDGNLISGYDVESGNTKIFRIGEDGLCSVVKDFGFLAGKASFSFDGRFVAYHKYKGTDRNNYFDFNRRMFVDIPPDTEVADIFVYDMLEEKHTQVTFNIDRNSLFPDFLENGNLIFVNHPHEKGEDRYFLEVLNPIRLQ